MLVRIKCFISYNDFRTHLNSIQFNSIFYLHKHTKCSSQFHKHIFNDGSDTQKIHTIQTIVSRKACYTDYETLFVIYTHRNKNTKHILIVEQ